MARYPRSFEVIHIILYSFICNGINVYVVYLGGVVAVLTYSSRLQTTRETVEIQMALIYVIHGSAEFSRSPMICYSLVRFDG